MSSANDLFTVVNPATPLAERLRPASLAEVVGQRHLLGPGRPLAVAFASGKPHSMILWGPPGSGKTTLARLMAGAFHAEFIALSAVLSGVKDIRDAIAQAEATLAQSARHTILFVDEVHRFNKAQQDAFLPFVERGLITFIGATTENPSFEVNSALLSRAAVYVLEPLTEDELSVLLDRALGVAMPELLIAPPARDAVIAYADGDARRLLNLVEQLAVAAEETGRHDIDAALVETAITRALRRFDKGGDAFYDQISALHKSVRGSDPDAALYWFCRMLDGGADPLYVGRRLIRMASEDVGLADPRALQLTLDAVATYERLGTPEGELALAEAVIYLACAAKSNAVYVAYGAARAFVADDGSRPVPLHLRNAPTRLMKRLGYGNDYRYAHDEPDAYAAGETYLPEGMAPPRWYRPTERGLEQKIGQRLAELKRRDADARADDDSAS
ncbi:MAG TPA: replication-associated recombination protein A [Casimicrobiaceae bacterium]|nr:replication-associated recombination protein A [Casimicrobiaceae bacterium]